MRSLPGYIRGVSRYAFAFLVLLMMDSECVYAEGLSYLFVPEGSNFYIYGTGGSYRLINREKLISLDIEGSRERLSSAQRIIRAGDDPSGLAVSGKIKSIINSLGREAMNSADLRNYMNYRESALARISSVLGRMETLVVKASGGILGRGDREIIQGEIEQLKREIDSIALFSRLNGRTVIPSLTSRGLGLDAVDAAVDLRNSSAAIESARERLMKLRAAAGVKSAVLSFRIKGKSFYLLNLEEAEGRISGLDYTGEIAALIRNSVLLKMNEGVLFLKK